jgi:hypothetical protein
MRAPTRAHAGQLGRTQKQSARERIWPLPTMHSRARGRAMSPPRVFLVEPARFPAPVGSANGETRSQEENSALAYAPHV